MEATTGTVTAADGVELFTRQWTPESPKANVLIVHGVGEHCGRWDHVARFLVDRGYAFTGFDLRGHGESGGDRVHVDDFDDFVEDVASVAATLDPDLPWVLYGHSMGALIATHYLISDRRQPAAAILSAPALDDNLPGYVHVAGELIGRVLPTMRIENSISADQLCSDPSVGEAYFADPLVQTKATTAIGREGFAAQREAKAGLDRIRVPTYVFHGAEDALVPVHASAPFAAVPGVERKVYPGMRHETHNEPGSDQVLGDVADWLDKTLA